MAQWVNDPPLVQKTQEMQIRSLDWENPLEEKMATHSSILAWKIPLCMCVYIYLSIYLCIHTHICICALLSRSVMSDSLQPHGLQLARLLCPWGFSRPEYWNGLPCPPPGDLPNLGMNPGLPHCSWTLYSLSHQGSPYVYVCNWIALLYSRD